MIPTAPQSSTRTLQILLGLIALAIASRGMAAWWLGDSLYFDDEAVYVDAARELVDDGRFADSFRREPAYPVFLALLTVLLGDSVMALRLGQAVVIGLGGLILFALGRRLFDDRVALLATFLYALDPLLVVSGALFYSEALAAVVLLVSLLLARSVEATDSLVPVALLGVSLGALVQIRQVTLVLVALVAMWLLTRSSLPIGRRLTQFIVLILVLSAMVAPWVLRNQRVFGKVVPLAPEAYTGTTPIEQEEATQKGYGQAMLAWIRSHPKEFLLETGVNFVRFWEPYPTRLWADDVEKAARLHRSDARLPAQPALPTRSRDIVSALSFGAEMALAALGIVLGWRYRRVEILFLGMVILTYALGYSVFEGRIRYRIPVMPEMYLLSALGVALLIERYCEKFQSRSTSSEQ